MSGGSGLHRLRPKVHGDLACEGESIQLQGASGRVFSCTMLHLGHRNRAVWFPVPCEIHAEVQSSTVQWYHHGSELSDTIDVERAPVGLLTHNIKIVGKTETGAHSVAFPGFDSTVVSGVEFRNMGRKHLGNYPWHWHMTGDLSTGVERAIFDGNSIHDSIFRCLSIHQTSGTKVRNNVMYNISGHCVYIEDGIWEENNVISKNLVLGVKSVREQFHHGVETSDMLTVPGEGRDEGVKLNCPFGPFGVQL